MMGWRDFQSPAWMDKEDKEDKVFIPESIGHPSLSEFNEKWVDQRSLLSFLHRLEKLNNLNELQGLLTNFSQQKFTLLNCAAFSAAYTPKAKAWLQEDANRARELETLALLCWGSSLI